METTQTVREQLALFHKPTRTKEKGRKTTFSDPAFASNKVLPIHRWIPWIAGFSSEFVQSAISEFLNEAGVVIDPFAGVGTTLVEAMKAGHDTIGFEINPYAILACEVKTEAGDISPEALRESIYLFEVFFNDAVTSGRKPKSVPPKGFNTREEFYSPEVLQKVLLVWDFIETITEPQLKRMFRLAFAATMVRYSNYSYEPSLGTRRGAGKDNIEDYDVSGAIIGKLLEMLDDIQALQDGGGFQGADAKVIRDSFFNSEKHLESDVADLLITSPPYLNNYHYIRNTRPHLYWLGFAKTSKDTEPLEQANFGKYWQTVRALNRVELDFDLPASDLADVLEQLRTLNPEKGVYGGNGWANYAAAYFNDCYRFALGINYVLKPGASALVVIGNSILQGVHIPTDRYLGEICQAAGLEFVQIHTPRQTRVGNSIIQSNVRVGKAKKGRQLYESVVELRKPLRNEV